MTQGEKKNVVSWLLILLYFSISALGIHNASKIEYYIYEPLTSSVEIGRELRSKVILEEQKKDFYQILQEHSDLNYNRETNNCYDQSKDIQNKLALAGIQSSIFINSDRSHAWLAVWIEATDSSFKVRGNHEISEIRDINLKIVCSNL